MHCWEQLLGCHNIYSTFWTQLHCTTVMSLNVTMMQFADSSQDFRATRANKHFFPLPFYNTVWKAGSSFCLTMSPDERTYLKQIALTSLMTTQASNVKHSPMPDNQLAQMLRSAEILNTKNTRGKTITQTTALCATLCATLCNERHSQC